MPSTAQPRRIYFYLSFLIFVVALIYGFISARANIEDAGKVTGELSSSLDFLRTVPPGLLFVLIFLNNALKAFLAIIFGFFFGLFPLYFVLTNGRLIGLVAAYALTRESAIGVLSSLLPHGVFELPAVLIAVAYGFWLGARFFQWLIFRIPFRPAFYSAVRTYYRVIIPLLFVAAVIEAYITPLVVRSALGL